MSGSMRRVRLRDNSDLTSRTKALSKPSPALREKVGCWSDADRLVSCPILLPQEIRPELVEAGAADLGHYGVDLGAENIDRLLDPRQAASDRAVKRRAAKEHELRTEAHRDQNVGAAP